MCVQSKSDSASVREVLDDNSYVPNVQEKKGCMIVRTLAESLDNKKHLKYSELAKIRRRRRLSLKAVDETVKEPEETPEEEPQKEPIEKEKVKKLVEFSHIVVRSYPIILGDNPSVSRGAPVSIGWKHFQVVKVDVDTFEKKKPLPRSKSQMKIPYDVRYDMLERSGECEDAVRETVDLMKVIKKQREATNRLLWRQKSDEKIEKFKRTFKNIVNAGNKK